MAMYIVQKNQVPEGSVQLKREELCVNACQLEKKDVAAVAQYNSRGKILHSR